MEYWHIWIANRGIYTYTIYSNNLQDTGRGIVNYPRRARSALGVDIVLTLDVCSYVCMLVL